MTRKIWAHIECLTIKPQPQKRDTSNKYIHVQIQVINRMQANGLFVRNKLV